MSTTITANLGINLLVSEVLDAASNPFVSSKPAENERLHKLSTTAILSATSTPPGVVVSDFTVALIGGAVTLDCTALPDGKNASGLKIRALYILNPATNANPISVAGGAANGYLLFGTGGKENFYPGEDLLKRLKDALPAVDGTHKNIDLAGTGAQTLQFLLVFG